MIQCKYCRSTDLIFESCADGVHVGQLTCGACKRWLAWSIEEAVKDGGFGGKVNRHEPSWQERAENLVIAMSATGMGVSKGQYQGYIAEAESLAKEVKR